MITKAVGRGGRWLRTPVCRSGAAAHLRAAPTDRFPVPPARAGPWPRPPPARPPRAVAPAPGTPRAAPPPGRRSPRPAVFQGRPRLRGRPSAARTPHPPTERGRGARERARGRLRPGRPPDGGRGPPRGRGQQLVPVGGVADRRGGEGEQFLRALVLADLQGLIADRPQLPGHGGREQVPLLQV